MNQQERNRRISEGLRLAWKRRKGEVMKPVPEPESTPFAATPHHCGLTPEEAQAAYDAAPSVPLSDERIQEIVVAATASPGPQTHEEARQFHEGFLSGATAYAAAAGHSTLKSDNQKLREVFDAQGWRTIETFEKVNAMTTDTPNRRNFSDELTCLLNKYVKENGSNTPDFVLAEFLESCLESWNRAIQTRENWYERPFKPESLSSKPPDEPATKLAREIGIVEAP